MGKKGKPNEDLTNGNEFGKRLEAIRKSIGDTQKTFGGKLGVSSGSISHYESGERKPDIDFLQRLYFYFDGQFSFEFLLGLTNNARHENEMLEELYGLTDVACRWLDEDPEIGKIISSILDHKGFSGLLDAYKSVARHWGSFNETEKGYISFLISDCLNHIIFTSLSTAWRDSLTPEDIEEIQKGLERVEERLKVSKEEFEKREEERIIDRELAWQDSSKARESIEKDKMSVAKYFDDIVWWRHE